MRYKRADGERAKWQDQNYLLLFYLQANLAATICLHVLSCKTINEHFISQWTNTIFFVCLLTHLVNKSLPKAQDIIIALERDLSDIFLKALSSQCWGEKKAGPANSMGRILEMLDISGPQHFWHQELVLWKIILPWIRAGMGSGLGIIQVHYIYCTFYFYYYYISSTSENQALDPGGWGPLDNSVLPSFPP